MTTSATPSPQYSVSFNSAQHHHQYYHYYQQHGYLRYNSMPSPAATSMSYNNYGASVPSTSTTPAPSSLRLYRSRSNEYYNSYTPIVQSPLLESLSRTWYDDMANDETVSIFSTVHVTDT